MLLEAVSKHMKGKRKIGNNQYGSTTSQLTNLFARPVDEGTEWMLYTLTMSKAFEMVCHSMFIAKSVEHELHSQQISG